MKDFPVQKNQNGSENPEQLAPLLKEVSPQEVEVLEKVLEAIRQIKFGYVQITIQDAHVVQIDRTEKHRLNRKNI